MRENLHNFHSTVHCANVSRFYLKNYVKSMYMYIFATSWFHEIFPVKSENVHIFLADHLSPYLMDYLLRHTFLETHITGFHESKSTSAALIWKHGNAIIPKVYLTFIKLNISYCICFCPQIKYSIQLGQLTVPVIWVSVWARFLARSARAKLGSAQLAKFKIWKSSARSPAKNFRLVPPLAFRAY